MSKPRAASKNDNIILRLDALETYVKLQDGQINALTTDTYNQLNALRREHEELKLKVASLLCVL
jgi:hypothetical protein